MGLKYCTVTLTPEDWWICRDWLFYGQADPHFDTPISDPGLLQLTQSIVANPRAGMRPLLFFFLLFLCLALLAYYMFPVCCCVWKKNISVCIMCVVFEEFLEPSFQHFYCKLYEVDIC